MAFTIATSQQSVNATTSVATFGVSGSSGDLDLAFLAEDSGATSNTWNNSFTELLDSAAATGIICAAAYKICTGGETSVTATHTTERSNHITINIPAAEWANDGTPPEISTVATGNSTTPDPPSISPSWGTTAPTIFIACLFGDDSAPPFPVTGWPTNYGGNQTSNNTASSAGVIALATRTATVTSEDPSAFTMTGTETWGAIVVAVKGKSGSGSSIPLAAAVTASASVSASLQMSLALAAGVTASASVSAALRESLALSAAVTASASLSGTLSIASVQALAAAVTASASVSASLGLGLLISGAVTASASVSAALTVTGLAVSGGAPPGIELAAHYIPHSLAYLVEPNLDVHHYLPAGAAYELVPVITSVEAQEPHN